jgi:hypothetical protein
MKLKTGMGISSATLLLALALSGCSILYPNWNTTAKPGDPATTSASPTSVASASASATPSPTATVAAKKAQVSWLDSGVDTAGGVVYGVAEITNAVEDGGTCTLTFIGAGKTKTVSGKAEVNATDTQCHPLQIPLAGLPKGAALITMTYSSPNFAGTSAAVAVTIP